MPPKKSGSPPPPPRPMTLALKSADIEAELNRQIGRYKQIAESNINSQSMLEDAERDYSRVGDFITTYLRRAFHDQTVSDNFSAWAGGGAMSFGEVHLGTEIRQLIENCRTKISDVQSIIEQLPIYVEPDSAPISRPQGAGSDRPQTRNVFVVHGHDRALLSEVARTLEKVGLVPIILHEQPNMGRTIIEKLLDHRESGFVVVLMTADDLGISKTAIEGDDQIQKKSLEFRARQNVLFEAGLFMGALGRQYVCILKESVVQMPSDLHGLVWTEVDARGMWRFQLATELQAAGFKVDKNKL